MIAPVYAQCHAMSRNVTLDKDKDKDKAKTIVPSPAVTFL